MVTASNGGYVGEEMPKVEAEVSRARWRDQDIQRSVRVRWADEAKSEVEKRRRRAR